MKYLQISAMVAMLTLVLTVPALAAGPFSNVPAGTALYEYGFAAAGIPVCDASLYPGGQALTPYENLMQIGRQLGLWPEGAVRHEFGHFLAGALGFPAEHERLFRAEGESAPLRNYAKTDSAEYFADCFAYWIDNSGSTQTMARFQAAAPRTYAYFQALAADRWGVSSGSSASAHGH